MNIREILGENFTVAQSEYWRVIGDNFTIAQSEYWRVIGENFTITVYILLSYW